MNQNNGTFEQSMQRLEQIVRAMERGDVPLEESCREEISSPPFSSIYVAVHPQAKIKIIQSKIVRSFFIERSFLHLAVRDI